MPRPGMPSGMNALADPRRTRELASVFSLAATADAAMHGIQRTIRRHLMAGGHSYPPVGN